MAVDVLALHRGVERRAERILAEHADLERLAAVRRARPLHVPTELREIRGLDLLLRQETDLPITVGDDPLSCVALGTAKVLDELELLKKVAIPA